MSDYEYSTLGVVTKGKLRVQDRKSFDTALARFPDGVYAVTIANTTEKAQRSLQANRFMWKVFELIGDEADLSKDDVHDLMCQKFLTHWVDVVDRTTGEIQTVQVTRGTSRLNAKEHAYFCDQVMLWASEFFGMTFPSRDAA